MKKIDKDSVCLAVIAITAIASVCVIIYAFSTSDLQLINSCLTGVILSFTLEFVAMCIVLGD